MNLKTLRKKIRKLETRLQEGPGKLARMKLKLEAMTKAKARKAQRKLAARVAAARRTTTASASAQENKSVATAQTKTKAVVAQQARGVRKPKRKLNLSPERRAQLAAAMKARWVARRAAAAGKPPQNSSGGDSVPKGHPQPA